jgi:hypothetical protein
LALAGIRQGLLKYWSVMSRVVGVLVGEMSGNWSRDLSDWSVQRALLALAE